MVERVRLYEPRTIVLTVKECERRDGTFNGWVDGKLVVERARIPFLNAARVLVAQGANPADILVMRHVVTGTDSLRAKVGVAAKLTVAEAKDGKSLPRFVPWVSLANIHRP